MLMPDAIFWILLAAALVITTCAAYEMDAAHRARKAAEDKAITAQHKLEAFVASCTCDTRYHELGVHEPGWTGGAR